MQYENFSYLRRTGRVYGVKVSRIDRRGRSSHRLYSYGSRQSEVSYYVSEVLNQAKPDLVINVGTAGSIDCQVGDILVCRHFIDRDMQKLANMGLEYEIDSSALLAEKGYCMHWAGEGICNTGDTFLTELSDVKGDVVDMEAFAQAFVCRVKNVPFIAVKYVTDIIGQNSVKHWEDKLADARKGLGEFFEQIGGAVK